MRPTRRHVLGALGGAGVVTTWGLGGAHAVVPDFDDYKALVCVYLGGGNDGMNCFVPLGEGTRGYGHYADVRTDLSVAAEDLWAQLPDLGQAPLVANPYEGDANGDFVHMRVPERKARAVAALIDHLDVMLLGGTLPDEARLALETHLVENLDHADPQRLAFLLFGEAIRFLASSTHYMVQK